MTNLPWIPYAVVLVFAFVIGLLATVAASGAVAAAQSAMGAASPVSAPSERPAMTTPAPEPLLPTIEV